MSLARAIETGDLAQLPSRRDEDWRWSDLRGLVRALPPRSAGGGEPAGPGPFAGLADFETLVVNGVGEDLLVVPAGERRTLGLRVVAAAGAGAHACRVEVEVGAGAQLTFLESYEGEAAGYVAQTDLAFRLGRGASVERVVLASDSAEAVSVSLARIALAGAANFRQTILTFGARRQRLETIVDHAGGGAWARLDGIYLVGARRHADITTLLTHSGLDGASEQLVKGVAAGQGRGVFQGRIVVQRGAHRTDARMGHHALVLSDHAEVDAKPELEIYADDVACAHGNTVGALDEEAIFYAASRGIGLVEARAILIEAFVGEVIDRIVHPGARERIRGLARARLEALA